MEDQQALDFYPTTIEKEPYKRPDGDCAKGFLERMRTERMYRIRVYHTLAVMWMFITLGWNVSMFGTTFPDLRQIIHKDLETASWFFTSGTLGYMAGALVSGVFFDRFNRLFILALVTVLGAATLVAIPWCTQFWLMLTVNVFNGFFTGGIDVGGNSHIASLWGVDAAPFMQCIHFGFSAGGILSPFTAEPFVAEKHCVDNGNGSLTFNSNSSSLLNTTATTTTTMVVATTSSGIQTTTTCKEEFDETHVQYAFLIAGALSTTAVIPFLVLHHMSPNYQTSNDSANVQGESPANHKEQSPNTNLPDLPLRHQVMFVIALMLLISMYAATEGRFSSLLQTFATEFLGWSKSDGLHLNSLFWGMFAGGRFLGIFVSRFLKPATMIGVYIMALNLAILGMLFAGLYNVTTLVWVSTSLAGLFMSVIFPAIFTWTAESILEVTGKISATYIVGVSVLNMALPPLYGHLMDDYTQMYFAYLLLAQGVISFVIYVIIRMLVSVYIKPATANIQKA